MLNLIVILIVAGVLLWGIAQIPMDNAIRQLVRVVVVVLAVLYVLSVLFPHQVAFLR